LLICLAACWSQLLQAGQVWSYCSLPLLGASRAYQVSGVLSSSLSLIGPAAHGQGSPSAGPCCGGQLGTCATPPESPRNTRAHLQALGSASPALAARSGGRVGGSSFGAARSYGGAARSYGGAGSFSSGLSGCGRPRVVSRARLLRLAVDAACSPMCMLWQGCARPVFVGHRAGRLF